MKNKDYGKIALSVLGGGLIGYLLVNRKEPNEIGDKIIELSNQANKKVEEVTRYVTDMIKSKS